jgi:carboxyl-terminal processing protease
VEDTLKRINFGGMLIFGITMLAFLVIGYLFGAAGAASPADSAGATALHDIRSTLSLADSNAGSKLIDRAFDQLQEEYFMDIDDATRQKMLYSALQGMLQPLRKDPFADDFTNFYDPEFYKNLMAETTGNYAGIGILMGVTADGGYPEVNTVFENTPAEKAGILVDDVITEVAGEDAYGMILPEVANRIKGEPGTKVKLKVYRPSDGDIKEYELERQNVTYSSVSKVELLPNSVGYLKISNFAEDTGKDFRAGMEKLSSQAAANGGLKSVIIDLRDNPGGLLNAAVDVADVFVSKDDDVGGKGGPGSIVTVEFRGDATKNETLYVKPDTKKYKLPVVIMVNASSASASEVLTSALRDYGVAKVFGEKSFGKGVVQAVTPMELESVEVADKNGAVKRETEAKSAMAIVIGKYFTPKHYEIHKHGIVPDIWYNFQNQLVDDPKLKGYEDQLEKQRDEANKIRTEATQYVRANDTIKNEAQKVAAALGRGEKVPDRAEVKPKEAAHDPLGLAPDRKEPQKDDSGKDDKGNVKPETK